MMHTFSPNWYKPQCLLFLNQYIFYSSNYVLYKYNLTNRKIEADRCFRKVAIKTGMNSKDIKIHTIQSLLLQDKLKLIVGMNQNCVAIVSVNNLQVLSVIKDIGIQSVYISCTSFDFQNKRNYAVFVDENGLMTKIKIKDQFQYEIIPMKKNNSQKIKQISSISLFLINIIVYNKGSMTIYDGIFDQIQQQITTQHLGLQQQYVMSIDFYEQTKNNSEEMSNGQKVLWFAMLTRHKNQNMYIHYYTIMKNNQMQQGKQNKYNILKINKCSLNIHYPKVMMQKIKNNQKAAMTIKLLSCTSLLISGKLGQIFIIDLQKAPQNINIKAHSLQQIPQYIQIVGDSKHYKQIYAIYMHRVPASQVSNKKSSKGQNNQRLYTISTDQTLAVWNIKHDYIKSENSNVNMSARIQFVYNIKFLTSQINNIFYSQADPKTVFFLLRDGLIRSCAPFSTQNYYLAQYWKFSRKFQKIVKAAMHLQEPGICAMITEDSKVLLYDIFDDRLMKIYQFQDSQDSKDQIINISFQYRSIMQAICKLSASTSTQIQQNWKQQKMKINKYYSKQIKNNLKIGLLIQRKSKLIFTIQTVNMQSKEQSYSIKRTNRMERIHNTKFYNGNSLLYTQNKNSTLKLWLYYNNQILRLQFKLKLNGRCIFKLQENSKLLNILQYKSKKAHIYSYCIAQNQLKPVSQMPIDVPLFIQQIVLDYFSNQAIFYNGKEDQLAYLEYATDNNGDKKQNKVSLVELGNKIQSLAFYFSDYVVIGFKDQSIKVLKLRDIANNIAEQPKKKVKKMIQQEQIQNKETISKQDKKLEQPQIHCMDEQNSNNVKMMSLQQ